MPLWSSRTFLLETEKTIYYFFLQKTEDDLDTWLKESFPNHSKGLKYDFSEDNIKSTASPMPIKVFHTPSEMIKVPDRMEDFLDSLEHLERKFAKYVLLQKKMEKSTLCIRYLKDI